MTKDFKEELFKKIDEFRKEMISLSESIHTYSELAFDEYKSSQLIMDTLEKHGFEVQRGVGSLKTAFKAVYNGKKGYPTVGFLAEYDALPGVGHGCGHNLIAPTSVFAAIALSTILKDFEGRIVVLGTPAEESGGGKIILIDEGAFEDINFALMSHPATVNEVGRGGRAITSILIEFFGKSAHSSAPENGINALKAVINVFNGIDAVCQSFPEGVNTNGIILKGGEADNIIPDYSSCQISVRANTRDDLFKAIDKIKEVIKASEIMTGASSKVSIEPVYAERHPNMTMEFKYKEYMEILGEKVEIANPQGKYGSSDIGNVSLIIPTIHTYFKIIDKQVNAHSKAFAELCIKESAYNGMLKSAKALALLGRDLFMDESFRSTVEEEFMNN